MLGYFDQFWKKMAFLLKFITYDYTMEQIQTVFSDWNIWC